MSKTHTHGNGALSGGGPIKGKLTVNGQTVSNNAVLANSGVGSITSTMMNVPDISIDGKSTVEIKPQGELVIKDKNGDEYDVLQFMKTVSERLCVLSPQFEAHEHYPALKEAYEHYKFLEGLLLTGNGDTK